MKEDVQQILTDLYAIRAGMSVISEKKDEIDQKFKSAKEKLLPIAKKTNNDIKTTTANYGMYTTSLGHIESDKDSPVKDHYEPEDFRCSVCGAVPEKGKNYNYLCPVCGSVVVRHARQADRQAQTRDLNVTESESFVRNTRYTEQTVDYIKKQVPYLKRDAAGGDCRYNMRYFRQRSKRQARFNIKRHCHRHCGRYTHNSVRRTYIFNA